MTTPVFHDRIERWIGRVLRAHEHQMLEQVRETRSPRLLIFRSDVVPKIDGDERAGAVLVENHAQSVVENEFLKGNRMHGGFDRQRA